MHLTPNALNAKISQLVKEGYPQKQAIAIAYTEMRIAWRDKHPVSKFPVWLTFETLGKNPISEKTAHKLRKAVPRTFMKMTDEEIKKSVKIEKKNPVRPLKKKTYFIAARQGKYYGYLVFPGKVDTDFNTAAIFKSKNTAIKIAEDMARHFPKWKWTVNNV